MGYFYIGCENRYFPVISSDKAGNVLRSDNNYNISLILHCLYAMTIIINLFPLTHMLSMNYGPIIRLVLVSFQGFLLIFQLF